MKNCKVSGTTLKRSVINLIGRGPRIGIDSALINKNLCSVATAFGTSSLEIKAAVYRTANNVWASGGYLSGIVTSFILKECYNESELKSLTRDIIAACDDCETYLYGGHTSVSPYVSENSISVTAIGYTDKEPSYVTKAEAGMDIVISKWIGLEEIAGMTYDRQLMDTLHKRFTEDYLRDIYSYEKWLTVKDEAMIADNYQAEAMHDISEGGVFAALWELSEGSKKGFTVNLKAIPVRQETIEICSYLNINPYKMRSSGSLLMITKNGEGLVNNLMEAGIPAAVIGVMTDSNDKIINNDGEIRYLERN